MQAATREGLVERWRGITGRRQRRAARARLRQAQRACRIESLEPRLLLANTFTDITATAFPGETAVYAAWADLNNNGRTDAVLSSGKIYFNNGNGTFSHVGTSAGGGIFFGDFNNDGYMDYATSNGVGVGGIYINQGGTGAFVGVGVPGGPNAEAQGLTLGDFNNDGWLDIFVPGFGSGHQPANYLPDYVYLSTGSAGAQGTSTYVLVEQPSGPNKPGRGATSADFDRDGDLDVYISNYSLEANHLWRNNGAGGTTWMFSDAASSLNATGGNGHSIGAAWGDFNSDGWIDLYAQAFAHDDFRQNPRPQLLRNTGPGGNFVFANHGEAGIPWQEASASAAIADFDNDGYLDMFVSALGPEYGYGSRGVLVRNNGNMTFSDATATWGLPLTLSGYHVSWADIDNDGDLDLNTNGRIYRNNLTNGNAWLAINLDARGQGFDAAAVGAQVRVTTSSGLVVTRQVEAGTGQGNQNDMTLHFGLGAQTAPVNVEIFWPDGSLQTLQLAVNQRVRIGPVAELPYSEDFEDGVANFMTAIAGQWQVNAGGRYQGTSTSGTPAVSLFSLETPLPAKVTFTADLISTTLGTDRNVLMVFDYQNANNFKFVGAFPGGNHWAIGRYSNGQVIKDATATASIANLTAYTAEVKLEGGLVELSVNGSPMLSHTFGDDVLDGALGLGVRNAVARYDNIVITGPTTVALPYLEDFEDGKANFINEMAGQWQINAGGRYQGTSTSAVPAVALVALETPLPASLEYHAELMTTILGTDRNVLMVFDYQDANNFKFAGGFQGGNHWAVGEYVGGTLTKFATAAQTIVNNTAYQARLELEGATVNFYVDGQLKLTHTYGDNVLDGALGLAVRNGVARFDNLLIQEPFVDPGATLPYSEDFNSVTAAHLEINAGQWQVSGGVYATVAGGVNVSTLITADPLPNLLRVAAEVNANPASSGLSSNGVLVFDYHDALNFKYAGAYIGASQWRLGRVVDGAWLVDASVGQSISASTWYALDLILDGNTASLSVDGQSKVSFAFGDSLVDGRVGLGTNNALAKFDNLLVEAFVPVGLPYSEDFNDGVADHLQEQTGSWQVNPGGRYQGTSTTGTPAVSLIGLEEALPAAVQYSAELMTTTLGTDKNALMVFDYQDANNFKFAGMFQGGNHWAIGRYTNGQLIKDVTTSQPLSNHTPYNARLELQGGSVKLFVEGVEKATYTYGDNVLDGALGLAVRNGVARFDNLLVEEMTTQGGASLPFSEDFNSGDAGLFQAVAGSWAVNSNAYRGSLAGAQPAIAVVSFEDPLPETLTIDAAMQAVTTGGFDRNGFIIFDYQGPTNFKFAGAWVGANQWRIGRYNGSWVYEASFSETISADTWHGLQLAIDGGLTTLSVNGASKVSFDFGALLNVGDIGVGSRNAVAAFDDVSIV